MSEVGVTGLIVFAAVTSLSLLILILLGGRKSRLDQRLEALAGVPELVVTSAMTELVRTTLPKMGQLLLPDKEEQRTKLRIRLSHAGFHGRQAVPIYLGVKLLLVVGPLLVGIVIGLSFLVPVKYGLGGGCLLGVVGIIAPSFWLDVRKAARQTNLRRAIPDALDVMVICLEGGTSLASALARVAIELRGTHPVLSAELALVQREMQLGQSAGDALRAFADRSDLEEIRSLSAVILQAERFGATLAKAMRIHAEVLRNKRITNAEEMAQKAAVKLLFPTALFILPALFVAILGPIMLVFWEMLKRMDI